MARRIRIFSWRGTKKLWIGPWHQPFKRGRNTSCFVTCEVSVRTWWWHAQMGRAHQSAQGTYGPIVEPDERYY